MEPFYFGASQKQLFGVYHAPESVVVRKSAVLLCQPLGHEYLRAHRAFRNLAVALAAQGFQVLRFDYYGNGDSGGTSEETSVDQCLADVQTSIEELRDISGVSMVSLVGLRLGATFAALTAAQRSDIDRLVLWDPVIDGDAYLRDLAALQQEWLRDRFGPRAGAAHPEERELLGFSLGEVGERQLGATRMPSPVSIRARSVRLLASRDQPLYGALRQEFEKAGVPSRYEVVEGSADWDRGDLIHQILLPHAMVRAIVATLGA